MLMILSPAKTFKEEGVSYSLLSQELIFKDKTKELVSILKNYSQEELGQLMKMSEALSEVNVKRFHRFYEEIEQAMLGIHAFEGEAYKGLDSLSLSEDELAFSDNRLLILSGLYGAIKPFDSINPYRLEMATKLSNSKGKDLYAFWKEDLTVYLLEQLKSSTGDQVLINLASNEYSKALDLKRIAKEYPVITIEFKEQKGETFKVVGMYAKRARGMMVRYILKNKIETLEALKNFSENGYNFNPTISDEFKWVFTR